jgi:hypothetical protein
MQRAYGLDPARLTLRRLWVLLHRIPAGTWPEADHPASWSVESYLLANVVDAANQVAWITAAANSKRKPPRPKAVPRPGERRRKGFGAAAWEAVGRDKRR